MSAKFHVGQSAVRGLIKRTKHVDALVGVLLTQPIEPAGAHRIREHSGDVVRDPIDNCFQMNSNGGDIRRLTAGPAADQRPAFSPDGSKLAFQSNRDGNDEIYVKRLY